MRNESYTYAPCAVKVRYSLHVSVGNVMFGSSCKKQRGEDI